MADTNIKFDLFIKQTFSSVSFIDINSLKDVSIVTSKENDLRTAINQQYNSFIKQNINIG